MVTEEGSESPPGPEHTRVYVFAVIVKESAGSMKPKPFVLFPGDQLPSVAVHVVAAGDEDHVSRGQLRLVSLYEPRVVETESVAVGLATQLRLVLLHVGVIAGHIYAFTHVPVHAGTTGLHALPVHDAGRVVTITVAIGV